jgi:hypothetical protein
MKELKTHLRYMGTCQAHNKIWFLNGAFNGLFSLDLKDFTIEYRHKIPYLDVQTQWAYREVSYVYGDKLFFFPANCKQIIVYDIEDDNIQAIPILPADGSEVYITKGVIQWKERLWIFPMKPMWGIYVLNLETLKIEKDCELSDVLSKVESIDSVVGLEGTKLAVLADNSTIIEIDISKKQEIYSKHFGEDIYIWGIWHDGRDFWLLPAYTTDIYEWNQVKDELVKYQLLEPEWITSMAVPYSNVVFLDDQIILLPCRLKYIMKINRETHTISKAIDYPEGFKVLDYCDGCMAMAKYDVVDHKIIMHQMAGNMTLVYDLEKNSIEGRELVVTNKDVPYLNEIIGQGIQINGVFFEVEEVGGLEALTIIMNKQCDSRNKGKEENIGEKIYSMMR